MHLLFETSLGCCPCDPSEGKSVVKVS